MVEGGPPLSTVGLWKSTASSEPFPWPVMGSVAEMLGASGMPGALSPVKMGPLISVKRCIQL